jgi:hypothetical protein
MDIEPQKAPKIAGALYRFEGRRPATLLERKFQENKTG